MDEQKQEAVMEWEDIKQPGTPREGEGKRRRSGPLPSYGVCGAASALYALFYTFCLYRNASGITYPFFVAGTLLYFFYCMKKCRVPGREDVGFLRADRLTAGWYTAGILLLGLTVCLTDDRKLLWMTKTGIFLLTITLVLRGFYRTGNWDFPAYLKGICRSLAQTLRFLDTPLTDAVSYFKHRDGAILNRKVLYAFLGLAAACPLLLVVMALLLSADAVFSDLLLRMVRNLDLVTPVRICLMAFFVYMVCYSFVQGLTAGGMPEDGKRKKKGEPVAAITATLLVALVYFAFCIVQIAALFLGKMRLPDGLTWAAYARQGFFQLLFVCLINLALVLLCLTFFRESRVLKAILTAISLMTYILIASSALRMILYIRNYYLTFLRLFVLWALLVIAVIFAGVILSIYKPRFPLFGYCTAVMTVCYLCFALLRPDYWVARYDLGHAAALAQTEAGGHYSDYSYLYRLSLDAAPVLLQKETANSQAFSYERERYCEKIRERTEDMGLRNFNFSRWAAKKSLETAQELSAADSLRDGGKQARKG